MTKYDRFMEKPGYEKDSTLNYGSETKSNFIYSNIL